MIYKSKIKILLFFLGIIIAVGFHSKTYAYEKKYEITENEYQYNSIKYTNNGEYVVVGNKSDRKSAYIAVYNESGEKIKDATYGGQFYYFYSVIQTSDNNYIAVGQKSLNYSDALIVKFDSDLNVIWENTYVGTKYERYKSVIETSNGDIVVAGCTDQINGNGEPSKGLIVKYDKNGSQLWSSTIGGTSYDTINSIIETIDSGYVVVGMCKSKDIEGIEINGESDAVIFKYDKDGNLIWKKRYGGSSHDEFSSIIKSKDGGYIIVGNTISRDIEGVSDRGQQKCLIVKYDKDFNLIWNKSYGPVSYNYYTDVVEMIDGSIIAIGKNNLYTYNEKEEIISTGVYGGLIVQYDKDGNMIYDETSKQEYTVEYSSIALRNNKFVIIANNELDNNSMILNYYYSVNIEETKNNKEDDNVNENLNDNVDETVAKKAFPFAGETNRLLSIFVTLLLILSVSIAYYKLNKIKEI